MYEKLTRLLWLQMAGAGDAGLTPREIDVLKMLETGAGTKEIAEQLNISQFTVYTHIQHLLDKLDVHRRSELVMHARASGLV